MTEADRPQRVALLLLDLMLSNAEFIEHRRQASPETAWCFDAIQELMRDQDDGIATQEPDDQLLDVVGAEIQVYVATYEAESEHLVAGLAPQQREELKGHVEHLLAHEYGERSKPQ